ncbi:ATP-binding protein [Klenkia soli]|uniref:ATP-binding protein n=1 Tax=Klenkia soli TaxID=1052260 RepID=UPI001041F5B8|nr:ATP-binding protein [Klenkia soli]
MSDLLTKVPWQHPDLFPDHCQAVAAAQVDDDEALGRLAPRLLVGLTESFGPEEAVLYLVMTGEFQAASRLVEVLADRRMLDEGREAELLGIVLRARDAAVDGLAARVQALVDRGDRVGHPVDGAESVVPHGQISLAAAEAQLADHETALVVHERAVDDVLRRDLATAGRPAGDRWVRHVEELLDVGEYLAARRALQMDPTTFTPTLPLGLVDQSWPWPSSTRAQIGYWFRGDTAASSRPAQFSAYIPAPGDRAAREVVDALQALFAEESGARLRWLHAVTGLVGGHLLTERTEDSGDAACRIRLAQDPQLPELTFVGRSGSVMLRTADTAPDAAPGAMDVRVSMRLTAPSGRAEPVLDISSVLALLVHDEQGYPLSQEGRRLAFLRTIASQADPEELLSEGIFDGDTHQDVEVHVWWALYLLGFRPRQSQVAALLERCGNHPGVLRLTMVREAARARAEHSDFDTSTLMTSPAHRDDVERTVHNSLTPAARLVLFTMLTWPDDVLDETTLQIGLLAVEDEAGLPGIVEIMTSTGIIDLSRVFRELERAGHLLGRPPAGVGRLNWCSCGVERLLARRAPQNIAASSLRELVASARAEVVDAADARLAQVALQLAWHNWDNLTRHLTDVPDAAAEKEVAARADQTKRAWDEESETLSLGRVCESAMRQVRQAASCDILTGKNVAGLEVRGGLNKLLQALTALIGNAAESAGARPASAGAGTVVVSYGPSPDGASAFIDIEDDGEGVPEVVRRSFAADLPMTTKEHGHGIGLLGAAYWLRAMQGDLEILGRSPTWKGAHLRITLPLAH